MSFLYGSRARRLCDLGLGGWVWLGLTSAIPFRDDVSFYSPMLRANLGGQKELNSERHPHGVLSVWLRVWVCVCPIVCRFDSKETPKCRQCNGWRCELWFGHSIPASAVWRWANGARHAHCSPCYRVPYILSIIGIMLQTWKNHFRMNTTRNIIATANYNVHRTHELQSISENLCVCVCMCWCVLPSMPERFKRVSIPFASLAEIINGRRSMHSGVPDVHINLMLA